MSAHAVGELRLGMRSTYMASLNHSKSAVSRTKLQLHGHKNTSQPDFPIPPQSLTLKIFANFGLV